MTPKLRVVVALPLTLEAVTLMTDKTPKKLHTRDSRPSRLVPNIERDVAAGAT